MKSENNRATISGEIVSGFLFSHELFGERFYNFDLKSRRESGTVDIIPVMISERLVNVNEKHMGKRVLLKGQFRSYNHHVGVKNHLILFMFATEYEEDDSERDCNKIMLNGFICKQPVYRETPLGREVADIFLAVNRSYGKSDYIPCICWGRNARFAEDLEVGTNIKIEGRMQSREYKKKLSDEEVETRTAYEISASKITVIEETEDNENEEEN